MCFFFHFATFFSADHSASFNLLSSSESSANSSAVYSETLLHPNSEQTAILNNFCLSAITRLPHSRALWAHSSAGVVPASCSSSWISANASSTRTLNEACCSFPFFLYWYGLCTCLRHCLFLALAHFVLKCGQLVVQLQTATCKACHIMQFQGAYFPVKFLRQNDRKVRVG